VGHWRRAGHRIGYCGCSRSDAAPCTTCRAGTGFARLESRLGGQWSTRAADSGGRVAKRASPGPKDGH